MLLKMRSLPPKASPAPDTGILKAVDGSDENAIRWFDMIKISCKSHAFPLYFLNGALTDYSALFLEQRGAAVFDPTDSRSFDLRYGSKLLPPSNVYSS
jgi:hypothetical protein